MCLGVHPQPLLNQDPVSACCFVSSGDLWMVGHPFLLSCFKHFFKLSLLSRLKKNVSIFFFLIMQFYSGRISGSFKICAFKLEQFHFCTRKKYLQLLSELVPC